MNSKVSKIYQAAANVVFAAILLFLVLNFLCGWLIGLKKIIYPFPEFMSKIQTLETLYPSMKHEEVYSLWREFGKLRFIYDPYTQFRLMSHHGTYIHIHPAGFRFSKVEPAWPPSKETFNIFIFGGSTTFGWGVSDEETIAACLETLLGREEKPAAVYNFAQGAFFSTQERIFFEELIHSARIPDAAIFIDGINESALDEPLYTNELRMLFLGKPVFLIKRLPLLRILEKINRYVQKNRTSKEEAAQNSERVINRYVENKKMISALSQAYGVQTFFVWQPAPLYQYDSNLNPFLRPEDQTDRQFIYQARAYALMNQMREKKMESDFLWLAGIQADLKKNLYVDRIHYSAEMNRRIAEKIYEWIKPQIRQAQA